MFGLFLLLASVSMVDLLTLNFQTSTHPPLAISPHPVAAFGSSSNSPAANKTMDCTFHSCTVHLDTIESFIYPTDARLDCSKNVRIYIKILHKRCCYILSFLYRAFFQRKEWKPTDVTILFVYCWISTCVWPTDPSSGEFVQLFT